MHLSVGSLRSAGWILALVPALLGADLRGEGSTVRGLPFTRSYSLEDIGFVPRGALIDFDRYGRLAAIHDAVYAVLNDTVWLNLSVPGNSADFVPMSNVVQAPDGRSYYGARNSWGYAEIRQDGRLHAVPLVPPNPPDWIRTALFKDIVLTRQGIFFVSWNGAVYWDFAQRRSRLFEVPGLSRAFRVGDRVYASIFVRPLQRFDPEQGGLQPVAATGLDQGVVEFATPLDETRSLVSFVDGRLAVFDGKSMVPWQARIPGGFKGRISVLRCLVDGQIAVGVTGQGLFLLAQNGELLEALTTSQFHHVTALANREPGVLWVATEEAIHKVLYGSPLSAFGQRLGLPISWPIVVSWRGKIYAASDGKLYRAVEGEYGDASRFELLPNQPPGGAWALTAMGEHMLVGSGPGLNSAEPDGTYRPVPSVSDLTFVEMIDPDHCFAIGRTEIGFLEWENGRWVERVPRIPGVRYPSIIHRVKDSVWIEMGGDGVARLWVRNGRLQLDVVPNASWTKSTWVNIGAVGDIVVLSTRQEEPRRFFDQKTGSWRDAPELERLLNRSPYWIARVQQDDSGILWASHNEGLVRFLPQGGGYDMDANSCDLVNDRYPVVHLLPGNDVWVTTERSLYHVDHPRAPGLPGPSNLVLVSLVDLRRDAELLTNEWPTTGPIKLPYSENSLSFRFFSGTDAWRRSPTYEYRLDEREAWTVFDGSQLTLRGLREGRYHLAVRIAGSPNGTKPSTALAFEILPPWTRTWPAYLLYTAGVLLSLLGVVKWAIFVAHKRNRALERLVQERTGQLKTTMARLNEETRNPATLAERNRLANEIHDSVQQGLTGAMLQLDSTLKLPAVAGEIRSRLDVVRNMVSYARQEVQHAVWDRESPLLERTELAEALKNLISLVDADGAETSVRVTGTPIALSRQISHNLLRIAQEATTNACRHAKAQKISIELVYGADPSRVSLSVTDDGAGFRTDEALESTAGHLGLRGIRTRVKQMRGELTIESSPGHGSLIRVVVPAPMQKG